MTEIMKWEVLELLSNPETRKKVGGTWEKHFSGTLTLMSKVLLIKINCFFPFIWVHGTHF